MLSKDSKHSLHKYIQDSGFYTFRLKLQLKCEECDIQLRIADKYFASSKTCCVCGFKKKRLSLNDRTFHCKKCDNLIDRDENAARNLVKLSFSDVTPA